MIPRERPSLLPAELALLFTSTVLLFLRLYASRVLGYGDAEALYATYALHPAPAYLDHPGLIGIIAGLVGSGGAPTPQAAHSLTAALATLVPAAAWGACRLAGAPRFRAAIAALVFALTPELAIGLFGLTPDLPLALLSLGCIGSICFSIRTCRDDFRGDLALIAAGLCAGLAATTKLPGLALVAWIPIATAKRRPLWLVASAVGLALLLFSPVARYEIAGGWSSLHHRFESTQGAAGFSLRNVGALLGGQLAYLSPFVFAAALLIARSLVRHRSCEPLARALFLLFALTAAPLLLLCLWSRVAEPHWLAPAYLPLAIAWARRPITLPGAVRRPLLPVAATLLVLVHVYVLTDVFPQLAGRAYDGRWDLANDMRMFPAATRTIRLEHKLASVRGRGIVVVAPHWTLAAQLAVILPPGTVIATAGGSAAADGDFARWVPAAERDAADVVLYVTDDRFSAEPPPSLGRRRELGRAGFTLSRGGRQVRKITLRTLGPAGAAAASSPP